MSFKFEIESFVTINASDERGKVVGRAEYMESANAYLVRYKSGDGRAVEMWWQENALSEYKGGE